MTGCGMLQLASRPTRPGRRPCRVLLLVMLLGPNTIAGALGVPVMTIGAARAGRLLCGSISALRRGTCGAGLAQWVRALALLLVLEALSSPSRHPTALLA